MPERDDFDEIVERLGLDLTFPAQPEPPGPSQEPTPPAPPAPSEWEDEADPVDEQFYRQVPARPSRPLHRGRAAAWGAVVGVPTLLAVCTLLGVFLPRGALLAAGLTFVAGALYLISQLPEHGPGRPDSPDDGAAL